MGKKKKKNKEMPGKRIYGMPLKCVFIDADRRYAVCEAVNWDEYDAVVTLNRDYAAQLTVGQQIVINEPKKEEVENADVPPMRDEVLDNGGTAESEG